MLTQMASAKSERFNSVHSREKVDENEDPNMYQEVKSEKSVDREEDRKPVNTPHKEEIFSENIFWKFNNFRCQLSGHLRIWETSFFS